MMTWVVSFFFFHVSYTSNFREKKTKRGVIEISQMIVVKLPKIDPPPYASLPPPGKQSKISNEIEFNLLIKST